MNKLTDKEFEMIRTLVKNNYGISLGDEKKSLVYSRLNGILKELNLSNFTDYYNHLTSDRTGEATRIFIDKITTNHTYFMREKEHFDFLSKEVLPYLEKKYAATKDIKLWCAGCSSGEEAYTLEILLQEYFQGKGFNTQILATDISTKALIKAYNGVYTKESLSTMPEPWLRKYFRNFDNNNMVVSDEIKKQIIFRRLNFMEPTFPIKKQIQVIFCRNVMIYFDIKTRDELVNKFYNYTDEGGYLFIGHSESLSHSETKYKYIIPAVYRK